ncbi:MAG: alanine--tRNA ligase [Planctomycetes bacterium]|nr:alanine--tRNA ligase [Planctomycetota bacterium]
MPVDPNELRKRFLDFFDARMKEHAGGKVKGSLILPSSSLQPPDPSTLFTSAGMHQFKDDFTGNLVHGTRATATVQKCMRTPDLENVGKTARHHTFFEMLGFFSFGDGLDGPNGSKGFFKKEAIRWIWDFYTLPWDKGGCGLDTSKLYVSVYKGDEKGDGRDEEAANYWREILGKLWKKDELEKRIFWLGEHDNFWPAGAPSQGPNGVCGPCSEIFYDLGEEYGLGDVETNGDRFMEIGNIVFTQYERSGPAPGKGTLTPLPSKNIDFGGGFERLVMVLDGAKTTLDCGLFTPVREALRASAPAGRPGNPPKRNLSPAPPPSRAGLRLVREKRIADHIRAVTFCMSDGILPSNEGAGYVVRRIIRRAFRDGSALGFDGPFLHKLVPVVVEHYGDAYPELKRNTSAVIGTIQQEEQQFSTTLERGLQQLAGLIRDVKKKGEKTLPGKPAFDLYQSQGLPREVVQDELAAEGLTLDQVGYDEAEEKHREASKGGKQVVVFEKGWFQELKGKYKPTQFLGYESCEAECKVLAIVRDGEPFEIIEAGDSATVVLDRTPFYGESGGQVGDRGSLHVGSSESRVPSPESTDAGHGTRDTGQALFEVADTQKRDDYFLHEGKLLHGKLRVGDTVTARVDQQRRDRIRANHSATHLVHAALRKVLGEHVVQRGSIVQPDRLRFDFSHPKALTFEEKQEIERLVNQQIQANTQVGTAVMAPEEAQKAGAMALFGEKYGDKVRVLTMGTRVAGVSPASTAGFQPADAGIQKRSRGRLPHWEKDGGIYFVTFRLGDALARDKRDEIEASRRHLTRVAEQEGRQLSASEGKALDQLFTAKMDEYLNAGYGACYFKDQRCAEVVANALKHFDGERYELHAWCVMPNHVHVVVKPLAGHALSDILHSWKSFTSKECNKLLGRTGTFWMNESYDRLIRDAAEYEAKVRYTLDNPANAGLVDWTWVGGVPGETPGTDAGGTPATRAGGTPVSPAFSMELCGGTHVGRTGDIGYFRILSEGSSSAGVRRIEAVTGQDAYQMAAEEARTLAELQGLTKAQPGKVVEKVQSLLKEVKDLKGKAKKGGGVEQSKLESIRKAAETVGDVTVYVAELEGAEATDLLTIKDALGQDGGPSAVLLGSRGDGRALLLVAFTKDLVGRGLHAGKIVGEMARLVGGGGGGKPDVAQAGGKNPEGLPEALNTGMEKIREALKA